MMGNRNWQGKDADNPDVVFLSLNERLLFSERCKEGPVNHSDVHYNIQIFHKLTNDCVFLQTRPFVSCLAVFNIICDVRTQYSWLFFVRSWWWVCALSLTLQLALASIDTWINAITDNDTDQVNQALPAKAMKEKSTWHIVNQPVYHLSSTCCIHFSFHIPTFIYHTDNNVLCLSWFNKAPYQYTVLTASLMHVYAVFLCQHPDDSRSQYSFQVYVEKFKATILKAVYSLSN